MINVTDTIVDLPNTIRGSQVLKDMVERTDTSIILTINHEPHGPEITVAHGEVIQEGFLAFEQLDPAEEKLYLFLIPRGFRRQLRKIREVTLILNDGERQYTLHRTSTH